MTTGLVTEQQWTEVRSAECRTYRLWHSDPACRQIRVSAIVARDVAIDSDEAGLPCSACWIPPADPEPLTNEQRLRLLVGRHHPDVDFDAHVASLKQRGLWGPKRIAAAISRLDPCEECGVG